VEEVPPDDMAVSLVLQVPELEVVYQWYEYDPVPPEAEEERIIVSP
jgi:hypothetical protein